MQVARLSPDSDDGVSSNALSDGTDTTYDRVATTYYADGSVKTRKTSAALAVRSALFDEALRMSNTFRT